MRYKTKTKQNRKSYGVYFDDKKNGMCTGKKKGEKVNIHKNKHNYQMPELTVFCSG